MRKFILNFIVIACVIGGCTKMAVAPDRPDSVDKAAAGVAGIVAHTESADRHVHSAMPHADATGKVYLTSASDEHTEVLASAAQTQDALAGARKEAGQMQEALRDQQVSYQKLEGRWFVRWGKWIERMLWIIGISWLLLGAASVFLGLGNPLSWTCRIGKEITRLLPIMNAFSWVRDWMAARRAVSVTTSTSSAAATTLTATSTPIGG